MSNFIISSLGERNFYEKEISFYDGCCCGFRLFAGFYHEYILRASTAFAQWFYRNCNPIIPNHWTGGYPFFYIFRYGAVKYSCSCILLPTYREKICYFSMLQVMLASFFLQLLKPEPLFDDVLHKYLLWWIFIWNVHSYCFKR